MQNTTTQARPVTTRYQRFFLWRAFVYFSAPCRASCFIYQSPFFLSQCSKVRQGPDPEYNFSSNLFIGTQPTVVLRESTEVDRWWFLAGHFPPSEPSASPAAHSGSNAATLYPSSIASNSVSQDAKTKKGDGRFRLPLILTPQHGGNAPNTVLCFNYMNLEVSTHT